MKAIDLWVFVCILFVFTTLAEYGLILHLTSRSGWQKKMDAYLREVTGKSHIKKIPAMKLAVITLRDHSTTLPMVDDYHPDMNLKSSNILGHKQTAKLETNGNGLRNVVVDSPKQKAPKNKLKIAYTIEFYAKIVYPLSFLIFNIAYWSYYLTATAES